MILDSYSLYDGGKTRPGISFREEELHTLRHLVGDARSDFLTQIGVELGNAVREGAEFYGGNTEIAQAIRDERPVIARALSDQDRQVLTQAAFYGFDVGSEDKSVIAGGIHV